MRIIILIFFITFSLNSNPLLSDNNSKKSSSTFQNTVMIGKIEFGNHIDSLPLWKVDAAMILVDKLTKKFNYFPMKTKIEIIDSLQKSNIKNPTKSFIEKQKINWVFNFRINQLQNILGVTLQAINISDSSKVFTDNGFAYLNLKDTLKKVNIYDIALSNAMQRAIAKTLKDSSMFSKAYEEYRVFPFPTLVVGGLEFIEDSKFTKWSLFTKKQVTSYDIVESIWEETYKQNRFIAYDIESRDSLYTMFNIFGIENYNKPRPFELKALSEFEVQYFITGTFQRVSTGAKIKMQLCKVNKYDLEVVLTQEEITTEDSIDELRKSIKSTTKKLINKFREKYG